MEEYSLDEPEFGAKQEIHTTDQGECQIPKEYQKKSPHLQTQYVLHQPDIMQLNQFQTFWETGYDVEMLKNVY